MAQVPISQRFRDAIRNFVRSPENDFRTSSAARARVFIDEVEPTLSRAFLLDYAERAMRAEERQAEKAAEDAKPDPQLKFVAPGFSELFRSPRQRLPVETGRTARRVSLEQMTIGEIRSSAAVFAKRAKKRAETAADLDLRRAEYLNAIAEEMSPYARKHYKLTFGAYLELRADGIEAQPKARGAGESLVQGGRPAAAGGKS